MPVLRSKSPRVEGGRCYPKLTCWGEISRGTLWGTTGKRKSSSSSSKSPSSCKSSSSSSNSSFDSKASISSASGSSSPKSSSPSSSSMASSVLVCHPSPLPSPPPPLLPPRVPPGVGLGHRSRGQRMVRSPRSSCGNKDMGHIPRVTPVSGNSYSLHDPRMSCKRGNTYGHREAVAPKYEEKVIDRKNDVLIPSSSRNKSDGLLIECKVSKCSDSVQVVNKRNCLYVPDSNDSVPSNKTDLSCDNLTWHLPLTSYDPMPGYQVPQITNKHSHGDQIHLGRSPQNGRRENVGHVESCSVDSSTFSAYQWRNANNFQDPVPMPNATAGASANASSVRAYPPEWQHTGSVFGAHCVDRHTTVASSKALLNYPNSFQLTNNFQRNFQQACDKQGNFQEVCDQQSNFCPANNFQGTFQQLPPTMVIPLRQSGKSAHLSRNMGSDDLISKGHRNGCEPSRHVTSQMQMLSPVCNAVLGEGFSYLMQDTDNIVMVKNTCSEENKENILENKFNSAGIRHLTEYTCSQENDRNILENRVNCSDVVGDVADICSPLDKENILRSKYTCGSSAESATNTSCQESKGVLSVPDKSLCIVGNKRNDDAKCIGTVASPEGNNLVTVSYDFGCQGEENASCTPLVTSLDQIDAVDLINLDLVSDDLIGSIIGFDDDLFEGQEELEMPPFAPTLSVPPGIPAPPWPSAKLIESGGPTITSGDDACKVVIPDISLSQDTSEISNDILSEDVSVPEAEIECPVLARQNTFTVEDEEECQSDPLGGGEENEGRESDNMKGGIEKASGGGGEKGGNQLKRAQPPSCKGVTLLPMMQQKQQKHSSHIAVTSSLLPKPTLKVDKKKQKDDLSSSKAKLDRLNISKITGGLTKRLKTVKGAKNGSGANPTEIKRGSGNNTSSNSVNNNNNNNKKGGGSRGSPAPGGDVLHHPVRKTNKIGGVKEDGLKIRGTPNLNTPLSRTRSGSRSSGGSSPAGLHGRGSSTTHKTASVAPAPARLTPKTRALNRFGFRDSKSGDSTDSVNSILSDAQTASDSNSNIFEEDATPTNGNVGECDNNRLLTQVPVSTASTTTAPKTILSPAAPTASNIPKQLPVTGQSSRITAFTRQLPKPQVITVKAVSPKASPTPAGNTPKAHSPSTHNTYAGRSKSPSVKSLVHTPLKTVPTNPLATAKRTPRVSHDSESSLRSTTELDSGLGSSSESDRIRGEGEVAEEEKKDGGGDADASEAWLKKKREQQTTVAKRKSRGSAEFVQVNGAFDFKRSSLEIKEESKKSDTAGGKEKRESPITYGMARQKFAPYTRGRYGYGYQGRTTGTSLTHSSSPSSTSPGTITGGVNSPSPGITKIPGSSGLVRNRVAMIETPQTRKPLSGGNQTPSMLRRSNLKKPLVRPTSLEKTPILVAPVTEKTVELSKPVCRKLEYSEDTAPLRGDSSSSTLSSSDGDSQDSRDVMHTSSHSVVEDILIVGSVEVETHQKNSDSKAVFRTDSHGSFYDRRSHDKLLTLKNGNESKADLDLTENEKLEKMRRIRESEVQKVIELCKSPEAVERAENARVGSDNHEATPDDSGVKQLSSPQSESSFEILESLSETTDLAIEEEGDTRDVSGRPRGVTTKAKEKVEGVDLVASNNSSATESNVIASGAKTKRRSLAESPTEISPAITAEEVGCHESSAKSKVMPRSAECVKSSSLNLQKNDQETAGHQQQQPLMAKSKEASQTVSERSRPPSVRLPLMESSVESHKSAAMTDSGEHSTATLSGKCTPTTLNTGRSDLDQDFLIDDEIADQPGLTFGGGNSMATSFFTDDGIFDDIPSSPPSHAQLKQVIASAGRKRADSLDTTSSVGGDDLMLDFYDIDEVKAGASSNRSSGSSSLGMLGHSNTGTRPKRLPLRIAIPGRRYEEEVLSPDASEIFSEWTAMMAEVSGSTPERCVSREGSTGGGRTPRGRLGSSSEIPSPDPRRPTVLRPPRQGGVTEVEGGGGGVFVDRTAYHYMYQDVTALKTMLLRLRRVLQAADTINPFDANLRNSLYLSLAAGDSPLCSPGLNGDKDSVVPPSANELTLENVDLRRQVVLLQGQMEERDRTIRLLQQQLAQSLQENQQHQQAAKGGVVGVPSTQENSTSVETPIIIGGGGKGVVNAATQTDRSSRSGSAFGGTGLSRAGSTDDGLGPTVSSEIDCSQICRGRRNRAGGRRRRKSSSASSRAAPEDEEDDGVEGEEEEEDKDDNPTRVSPVTINLP